MPTYDEHVSKLTLDAGEAALAQLRGDANEMARAIMSAATISAHWLLSDNSGPAGPSEHGLSGTLRSNHALGDPVDRDAVDWVIGICALLFVLAYAPVVDRSRIIKSLAASTELDDALVTAGTTLNDLVPAAQVIPSRRDAMPVVEAASELLLEGCSLSGLAKSEPILFLVMIDKFEEFFSVDDVD